MQIKLTETKALVKMKQMNALRKKLFPSNKKISSDKPNAEGHLKLSSYNLINMLKARSILLMASVAILALLPQNSYAKDNSGHTLAIGFQIPNGAGSALCSSVQTVPDALLSAKFAAAPSVEFAAMGGILFTDEAFVLTLGAKALYIFVPEEHINVYAAVAAYPTTGTGSRHRFDWFMGPGLAIYPPFANSFELFTEFGIGGSIPLSGSGAGAAAGPRSVFLGTTGRILFGLHYWF